MTPPPESAATEKKATITITVDGHEVEAHPGELVIAAAERNGVYIPRFCYHPRMEPVGMCRMCLVNVEGPRGTSMQVSCMLTATEGMKVDTKAPDVKKAQDGVLEFLLANHPLDCPVCDKGGECPLQDQTLAFGPGETRFVEEKRHYEKPIDISNLVALDRERCILCDRCTRFAKDVAGDPLIHFTDRGNATQVNTFPDHPFSSYFSGNTVQICPVGALTAKPYRFKARPWDLEQVESTCTSCSVGCRVAVQSSGNEITRYLGLDAEPTNHGWMCDKGRFDFQALSSKARFTSPMVRRDGEHVTTSWSDALDATAEALRAAGSGGVGIIGGARLANEDQYLWAKLAKAVIGTDDVDAQLGDGLPAPAVLGVPRATIDEACAARAVVLLAPDLKEELPVLYLRLRDAVQRKGLQIIEIAPERTSCTPLAAHHLAYRTGDAAAVVGALLGKGKGEQGGVDAAKLEAAAAALRAAGDVVMIFGRQSVAESADAIAAAVGLFARHSNARFLPALRRSNVMGALDMGLAPGMLPGRVTIAEGREWYGQAWGNVPDDGGRDTAGILRAAADGAISTLVLLGADPIGDFPDRELARQALQRAGTVIAIDILPNRSTKHAHIVLPAATYAERPGTTTNIEGRITRLGQKITPPGVAWPDWVIATEIARRLDADFPYTCVEDVWAEIEAVLPSHRGITAKVVRDRAHRDGITAPVPMNITRKGALAGPGTTDTGSGSSQGVPAPIDPEAWPGVGEAEWHGTPNIATAPQQERGVSPVERPTGPLPMSVKHLVVDVPPPPPVDGYGVRLVAARKLYDMGTLVQHSPHLAELVRERPLRVHPSVLAPLGIDEGKQIRLRNARGTLVATVEVDDSLPRGVVSMPCNLDGAGVGELIDAAQPVTNVRLETP